MTGELDILAKKYGTDKQTNPPNQNIYHGYTPLYEMYFEKDRLNYKNMLEIGVWDGRSLKMWYDYFPNCTIWGIDNMNAVGCLPPEQINNDRIIYLLGDQGDGNFLNKSFDGIVFDTIIDDGSHFSALQQLSFKFLFPKLKSGGIYFIEDLGTCLLRQFRQYSDIRSTTTSWLASIQSGSHFSYYMTDEDIKDIANVEIFGELGVIHKK